MSVRTWIIMFICTLLLSLTMAADAASVRMPPGSFLTRHVNTPQDLANLVRQDDVVASRFSKHFGMDAAALADYFQNNLTVSTVQNSGKYALYFVDTRGRIVLHKKYLKSGTKVFRAFNGQLIIYVDCGNPFAKFLPQPVEKVEPVVEEIRPEPPPAPPPLPEPVVEVPAPLPVEEAVLAQPPIELPALAKTIGWILPVVIGAGTLVGGHEHNEVVPEPTGFLVLGAGGAGLLFDYLRKRRRQ